MKFLKIIVLAASFMLLILSSCNHAADNKFTTLTDTVKIQKLLDSGNAFLWREGDEKQDLDSAYAYFSKAEKLSDSLGAREWKNNIYATLGDYYYESGNDSLGKAYFMRVIQDYQRSGDLKQEALAWLRFGNTKGWDQKQTKQNLASSQMAFNLFKKNGNTEDAALALKQIADIHYQLRNIPLAEIELLEVLKMYQSINYKNLHYTYDLLSGIAIINGRYNKALFYAQEMIKSMHSTGDSISAGSFYLRLADIYFRLGNYTESIKWWRKSYDHYYIGHQTVRYDLARSTIFAMIGAGQSKQGLEFIKSILKIMPPRTSNDKRNSFLALGMCYEALGKYKNAEGYFTDAINEDKLTEPDALSSTINFYTGRFYVNTGRYSNAVYFLQRVIDLRKQYPGISRIMDTEYLLFKVDSAAARPYLAIKHLQVHNMLKDSIFNETKSKQIEELQIQYETDKKEQNIQLLENHAKFQQINLNITYGGILFLLIIIGVLYNFYRIKKKSNDDLQSKQIVINQKNSSLLQLVNEKEWLLKEIHHRVKNNLQIVQSLLNSQASYLKDKEALSAIQNSKNRVQAISLIHQKLYQSDNMAMINMNIYIQELCLHLRHSFETSNRILFELNIDAVELDVSQAVPVGLIMNEAITNSIKYAFPDDAKGVISISLQQVEGNTIVLTVTDNGIGLPENFNALKNEALGIKLMNGLSEDLDGKFSISQDQGTVIKLSFVINKSLLKKLPSTNSDFNVTVL
ncbi:tetratricopeptide repeat-containing sensor histidine kinase [Pedobacter metabolipauper]|uniref:histidine kinase n=1 Tax=Pedobacter metabolipauper TaxID=425513 RepID=A0A4R6SRW6_9SPHI|nr:sensor histidine kinase [Pedobacter metabolipauper]TDQ07343.1 two-component sensor histidine kinase [Pedobacter metabolipauper]